MQDHHRLLNLGKPQRLVFPLTITSKLALGVMIDGHIFLIKEPQSASYADLTYSKAEKPVLS